MKVSSLEQCSLAIKNSDAKTIAIQFPDYMLEHAHAILMKLEADCTADFYILADSPYSECCVDFVAAKHIDADLIVHFGNVCDFTIPPGGVPVIFMISQISISWNTCVVIEEIRKLVEGYYSEGRKQKTLVIWGMEESYFLNDDVASALKSFLDQNLLTFDKSGCFSDSCRNELNSGKKEDFDQILFVGEDGPFFDNIKLKYFMSSLYILSSESASIRHIYRSDLNRMITKRYHVLSKIASIEKVGIVVADVSSYNSESAIDRIRSACALRAIQTFVISVGKINEAKLANISGLDFYILVSCPYVATAKICPSLVPLVTPYEFGLLLRDSISDIFTGSYVNFLEFQSFSRSHEDNVHHESEELMQVSISRQLLGFCDRTFTGLQIDVENRDLDVYDGSFGIASTYFNEPKI